MNQTSAQLKTLKRTASLDLCKWYMGILLTNLVEKKDTDGAFFLLEATLLPGNEPPPHVHTREDELFYVLEGEFDVYVGEGALEVKRANASCFPNSSRTHLSFVPLGFACSFSTPPEAWRKPSAE